MRLTVFKLHKPKKDSPSRGFAAWQEDVVADDRGRKNVGIILSEEQAEELCTWLAETLYNIRLERKHIPY